MLFTSPKIKTKICITQFSCKYFSLVVRGKNVDYNSNNLACHFRYRSYLEVEPNRVDTHFSFL
jgi:hypothetical protein